MKKKEREKWAKIIGGAFILFLVLSHFGVIPPLRLGANYDINDDGDIDHLDLKYCVVNKIDCDYAGIIDAIRKAGGYPLAGLVDDCTSTELNLMDTNDDCMVSDTELLVVIDAWSTGDYTDTCLLSAIDIWASAAPSTEIPGCGTTTTTSTTTTTVPTTTTQPTGCSDTDGGKDYYTKGTCSDTYLGNPRSLDDDCSGSSVVEWYCRTGACTLEFYSCPHGCENGACVSAPATTTTTTQPTTTTSTTIPTTTTTTIPTPPKPPIVKVFEDFMTYVYSIFNTIVGFIFQGGMKNDKEKKKKRK